MRGEVRQLLFVQVDAGGMIAFGTSSIISREQRTGSRFEHRYAWSR